MTSNPGLRTRRGRLLKLPLTGLVMVLTMGWPGTASAASETLYLESTGVPVSFLSETYPTATTLPNFDPWRDVESGLLVKQSVGEYNETDPERYQIWMTAPDGLDLNGPASLQFWSAMKNFELDKKGAVMVQLLDCDVFLTDCRVITSSATSMDPWSGGSTDWVQREVSFDHVEHVIPEGRSLAVKLVVQPSSGDHMMFAYSTTAYPSSLSLTTGAAPPPPTTTTTAAPPPATTTTTTTPPPTTTTLPAATTTTTAPPTTPTTTTTTTSTPPPTTSASPSTTTTIPLAILATTTTLPKDTDEPPAPTTATAVPDPTTPPDTTTTLPPSDPAPPDDPPSEPDDVAGTALPTPDNADRGGSRPGGTFSNALLDGLTLVVPPAVAAALLSPLVLLEAILAVFVSTGRELVLPLVTLVGGVAWIGGRHRRPAPVTAADNRRGEHHA